MPVLKGVSKVKSCLYKILTKIQTKEERLNILKTQKTGFRENFDFRELCVSLTEHFNGCL